MAIDLFKGMTPEQLADFVMQKAPALDPDKVFSQVATLAENGLGFKGPPVPTGLNQFMPQGTGLKASESAFEAAMPMQQLESNVMDAARNANQFDLLGKLYGAFSGGKPYDYPAGPSMGPIRLGDAPRQALAVRPPVAPQAQLPDLGTLISGNRRYGI